MSSLTRKLFGGGTPKQSQAAAAAAGESKPPKAKENMVSGPKLENVSSRKPPLNGASVPIGPKEILSIKNQVTDLKSDMNIKAASPVSSQYNSAAGTGS